MKTEEKILNAATKLFKEKGYVNTTTIMIAQEAKVSEMSVFRYFKTKENLFKMVVEKITEESGISFFGQQMTGCIKEDLAILAFHTLQYFAMENKMIRMMLFESLHHSFLASMILEAPKKNILYLSQYLETQTKNGQIHCSQPEKMAELFFNTLLGYGIGPSSLQDLTPTQKELKEKADFISASFLQILNERKDV